MDSSHEREPSCYRDLRSASRATRQYRKQLAKYYGFRGVKPSWVGQEYYSFSPVLADPGATEHVLGCPGTFGWFMWPSTAPLVWCPPKTEEERGGKEEEDEEEEKEAGERDHPSMRPCPEVRTWTRRDNWLDRDIDIWPLDRRHHVGLSKREKRWLKFARRTAGRDTKSLARRVEAARLGWVGGQVVVKPWAAGGLRGHSDEGEDVDFDSVYEFGREEEEHEHEYEHEREVNVDGHDDSDGDGDADPVLPPCDSHCAHDGEEDEDEDEDEESDYDLLADLDMAMDLDVERPGPGPGLGPGLLRRRRPHSLPPPSPADKDDTSDDDDWDVLSEISWAALRCF